MSDLQEHMLERANSLDSCIDFFDDQNLAKRVSGGHPSGPDSERITSAITRRMSMRRTLGAVEHRKIKNKKQKELSARLQQEREERRLQQVALYGPKETKSSKKTQKKVNFIVGKEKATTVKDITSFKPKPLTTVFEDRRLYGEKSFDSDIVLPVKVLERDTKVDSEFEIVSHPLQAIVSDETFMLYGRTINSRATVVLKKEIAVSKNTAKKGRRFLSKANFSYDLQGNLIPNNDKIMEAEKEVVWSSSPGVSLEESSGHFYEHVCSEENAKSQQSTEEQVSPAHFLKKEEEEPRVSTKNRREVKREMKKAKKNANAKSSDEQPEKVTSSDEHSSDSSDRVISDEKSTNIEPPSKDVESWKSRISKKARREAKRASQDKITTHDESSSATSDTVTASDKETKNMESVSDNVKAEPTVVQQVDSANFALMLARLTDQIASMQKSINELTQQLKAKDEIIEKLMNEAKSKADGPKEAIPEVSQPSTSNAVVTDSQQVEQDSKVKEEISKATEPSTPNAASVVPPKMKRAKTDSLITRFKDDGIEAKVNMDLAKTPSDQKEVVRNHVRLTKEQRERAVNQEVRPANTVPIVERWSDALMKNLKRSNSTISFKMVKVKDQQPKPKGITHRAWFDICSRIPADSEDYVNKRNRKVFEQYKKLYFASANILRGRWRAEVAGKPYSKVENPWLSLDRAILFDLKKTPIEEVFGKITEWRDRASTFCIPKINMNVNWGKAPTPIE
nr:MAG: hypothetical protein [Chemarfal virus 126]